MMASVFAGARTFGLSMGASWAAQILVAVPVLAATVWAVRRTATRCSARASSRRQSRS